MNDKVKPIPDGFHSLTPHIVVRDAAGAIKFYKQAFGAVELGRMPEPNGTRTLHAMVRIGDSILMMVDHFPEWGSKGPEDLGGSPVTINIYCHDVDKMVADAAAAAGATVTMPPADMFWGDRYAKLTDPYGHEWAIATHISDPSEAEMQAGAEAAFAGGCPASE